MARHTAPSRPRPGASGLTRICARCQEPVTNALKHVKLDVWLCQPCVVRLDERIRGNAAKARDAEQESKEFAHMVKGNVKLGQMDR